jgi:hypothetical protein
LIDAADRNVDDDRIELFAACVRDTRGAPDPEKLRIYREALLNNDAKALKALEASLKPETDFSGRVPKANPEMPSFSESVQIRETALQGRFAIAARDIKAGHFSDLKKKSQLCSLSVVPKVLYV